MSIILHQGMSREEIQQALERLPKPRRFDAARHRGCIVLRENPLTYQRKLRDEWR
ncbi:MAG: hypothetical protein SF053_17845 [Bacteroidia bacterium]|nr:hypothetical protein [Bacteroidia bacterium]